MLIVGVAIARVCRLTPTTECPSFAMGNIRLSPPKSQSVQNKVQTMSLSTIKSLTQTLAQQLDVELMSPTGGGFSIDQVPLSS